MGIFTGAYNQNIHTQHMFTGVVVFLYFKATKMSAACVRICSIHILGGKLSVFLCVNY